MSPGIFGSLFVGSVVLLICSVSVVLYSAGSGVKSVVVVLDALRVSWFCMVQSNVFLYVWLYLLLCYVWVCVCR